MTNRESVKILVVDDFEDFRKLVLSVLRQRAGFQIVAEASDGLEALQTAKELQPDLIVLDIGLPNLSGIAVARQVRKQVPSARILFLSVETSAEVIREALNAGGLGYVHKPRVVNDLLPAIDAVLVGKRFVTPRLEYREPPCRLAPHRHEIIFCRDDEAVLEGLTQFIASALEVGNPALVVVTELHHEMLLKRLRRNDVPVDVAMQRGTYAWLDADEVADPKRLFELAKRMSEPATSGQSNPSHPRLALCGEGAGRLWAEGKTGAALEIERMCNQIARLYETDILCTYHFGEIDNDDNNLAFKQIAAEHSAVRGCASER